VGNLSHVRIRRRPRRTWDFRPCSLRSKSRLATGGLPRRPETETSLCYGYYLVHQEEYNMAAEHCLHPLHIIPLYLSFSQFPSSKPPFTRDCPRPQNPPKWAASAVSLSPAPKGRTKLSPRSPPKPSPRGPSSKSSPAPTATSPPRNSPRPSNTSSPSPTRHTSRSLSIRRRE
jgi:hypothetical protein